MQKPKIPQYYKQFSGSCICLELYELWQKLKEVDRYASDAVECGERALSGTRGGEEIPLGPRIARWIRAGEEYESLFKKAASEGHILTIDADTGAKVPLRRAAAEGKKASRYFCAGCESEVPSIEYEWNSARARRNRRGQGS